MIRNLIVIISAFSRINIKNKNLGRNDYEENFSISS